MTTASPPTSPAQHERADFDIARVRADFPALAQTVRGKPLVYLDSAASAQKPQQVIDAVTDFYQRDFANIHRGSHYLSDRATEAYEQARHTACRFINAQSVDEIVFVRGCTEGINLVASSFGEQFVASGDEIVVSEMEHHSNFVPWQQLCQRRGAKLRILPITDTGELDVTALARLLNDRTKLVALTHASNVLGTVVPVQEIADVVHAAGAKLLIDGAQAAPHLPVDVQALDCDFYAFSGHKVYGPSGIGVLYGKRDLLEQMPPYQTGGGMVDQVTLDATIFLPPPLRFEAGTPNIAGAIGLTAALNYVSAIGFDALAAHENELLSYAQDVLADIPGFRIMGAAPHRVGVISFTLEGAHPQDIGTLLDQQAIAIRVGHHCAQPLVARLGVSAATARASLGMYNNRADIDALATGLHKVRKMLVG